MQPAITQAEAKRRPGRPARPPMPALPDVYSAPVLTILEAAHFLRVSRSTVKRLVKQGRLEMLVVSNKSRGVRGDSLRRLLGVEPRPTI
jgi:excisionase family DNA binding protein